MKRHLTTGLAALILLGAASIARAHHSHPLFYDQCRKVTLEGRVESVQWKNPHVLIVLKLDDGSTSTAEWTSLQALGTTGVAGPAQAALTAGMRVVVTGNPLRDPAQIRASFPAIKEIANRNVVDIIEIRRMDAGWSWSRPAGECK